MQLETLILNGFYSLICRQKVKEKMHLTSFHEFSFFLLCRNAGNTLLHSLFSHENDHTQIGDLKVL